MAMSTNQPANLIILPSFVSQDLGPDGKHLSPVSGLHYLLHLFDQSEASIALQACGSEVRLISVQESVRQHDDRLSYLGLHDAVNLKAASDAEFRDWTINRSEEDWFTVMGLPRLGQMLPREWQKAARRQVNELIKIILNSNRVRVDYSILYVGNPLRHRKTGGTVYNVRLNSVAASSRIRELFSGFFRGENPVSLPDSLRGISVRNKVTLATRIRLRILRELGNLYVEANPGSSFKARGFDPRPMLLITPARGSTDRPKMFNFIEAATTLSASFSDDNLAQIFAVVGASHEGELRQLFIVITDDERERCLELVKGLSKGPRRSGRSGVTTSATASGSVFGSGSGVTVDAKLIASLRSPPPPPPPAGSPSHRRKSDVPEHPHRGVRRSQSSDQSELGKKRTRSQRSSSESSTSSRVAKKRSGKRRQRRSSSSSSSGSSGSSSSRYRTKSKPKSKSKSKPKSKRH